mgnify:CR=1 FL=1|jgi:hypothetical protein|tara:strand:+ start:217 stop:366 length:150 start_codon:yes stop_codon:yes gene_type:complete
MAKKSKKIRSGGGQRMGAVPTSGAPKQKQSTGGKVTTTSNGRKVRRGKK